ncbi:MAG: GGDEF domain-containing protein [Lachnospiraceae bacterium]|nr:GGDEF domain-containing protein [Lachnospiraceae bacterium]
MGFDYFVFYTEASLVCVIILTMILITDRMFHTKQEKQIWFSRAISAFILYFISDACWAAMLSGMFPKIRFFAVLFNYTNYILISLMGYGLFAFIAVSGKMSFFNSIRNRRLCFIPVVVSVLFISIAYVTNPLFWINENNELNALYFPLMFAVPSLYLIAGFIFSVAYAFRSELREEKRRYLVIGSVPFGVMAFGMIQVVALNAPTFCFGCTIMWLWFYIQNTKALISVDDLTHLNNRGQINRYLEQIRYSEDSRVIILMIDIDKFKGINDRYGHAEGDRALVIVSDALRQTCDQINASVFLGRYGGDEFTIIIQNPKDEDHTERVITLLRNNLAEKQQENSLPYELDVSIGYDEVTDGNDSVYACMSRADEKLYIDKQRNAGKM